MLYECNFINSPTPEGLVKLIRLLVHVLLSAAVSAWVLRLAGLGGGVELLNVAFVASLCLNWLMDHLGHSRGRRSPATHEPLNASLISALLAASLGAVFVYDGRLRLATFLACGVAHQLHLLLDLVSGGIYVREGSSFRRVRLAGPRGRAYEVANGLLLAASILITAAYLAQG